MRPIVCERKTTSASGTAASSETPRSIAPAASASAIAPGELTPVIAPVKPALRKASPKLAPISPVPTMTTFCILNGPAHRKCDGLQLMHQFFKLIGPHGLRAVAERAIGVGMNFHQQSIAAGCDGGARHRGDEVASSRPVGWVGDYRQVGQLLNHRDRGEIERVLRIR